MPRRIHIGISTKTHVSHCLVPHKCPTRSPFVICSFTRETLNSASRLGHLQNPLLPLECLTLIVSPSLEHLLLLRHWHLQWQPAISEKLVAESSSPSPTPTTTTGGTLHPTFHLIVYFFFFFLIFQISEKSVSFSHTGTKIPNTKFYQRHAFPLQLQMFDRVLAVHNYWLAAPLQLQQGAKVYG
ncbi:PREDICTED: uncharacterized protein LOC104599676 isoform X1 [Nelumbo nucifera]|uniref:Uncharacterized protein LOC104599676 isoform X1 n=1 Tax=Nelumbo nucifera TaxID=4432 RepID=A0A1U8Q6Q2_NELNU|nr:PREDICTED: uncharacterized protein LOC104599676 isoform X1 [Nelumbo nucifera]